MKTKVIILLTVSFQLSMFSQNWKGHGLASSGITLTTLITGNLNDTIYASGNGNDVKNRFTFSKDKGKTWSSPVNILEANNGSVTQYLGVKDRVYASVKLQSVGNLYYHSKDNGVNWEVDTIGMSHYFNIKSVHKAEFILKKMGDDYIVAYNGLTHNSAYYKKVGDPSWKPLKPTESNVNVDFTSIGNTWYALSAGNLPSEDYRIMKSIDNGVSWKTITKTGLPQGFGFKYLESNKQDKLYLADSVLGTEKTAVYYSKDGGTTWLPTNASTIFPYANGNVVTNLFANKKQVIVTYNSAYGEVPKYLYSSSIDPIFSVGDSSGLPIFPLAWNGIIFNIDNTFYIRHVNDIWSSNHATLGLKKISSDINVSLFPNPTLNSLKINSNINFSWKLSSILGKTIKSGFYTKGVINVIDVSSISGGVYIFSSSNGYSRKIIKK